MDLETLKSAEVIEDPSKIAELIKNRGGNCELDDDSGCPSFRKSLGTKAKDGGAPAMPSEDDLEDLVKARGMEPYEGMKDRAVRYWGSDERVDGEGDIVRQNWIFDEFEKNSPMQFGHRWHEPPVGRIIDWQVLDRKEKDYEGPALYLLGLFAKSGDWEWADSVHRLVSSGVMNSGSVGFYASKVIDVKDEDERAELGLGRWGLIFEQNHLLEYSPVAIPANPGAVALCRSAAKSLKAHDMHLVREIQRLTIRGDENEKEQWLESETALLSVARTLWPDNDWTPHKDLDVPVILDNHAESITKDGDDEELTRLQLTLDSLVKRFDEHATRADVQLNEMQEQLEALVERREVTVSSGNDESEEFEISSDLSRIADLLS